MGRKEQERRKGKPAAASLLQNIEHMFKKMAKQSKAVIPHDLIANISYVVITVNPTVRTIGVGSKMSSNLTTLRKTIVITCFQWRKQ